MTEAELLKELVKILKQKTPSSSPSSSSKQQVFDCHIRLENDKVRIKYRKSKTKHNLTPNCQVVFEDGKLKSIDRLLG